MPYTWYPHDTYQAALHDGTEYRELCTHGFVRESKDPAKMTHAKMALVERGLGAKQGGGLRNTGVGS